MDPVTQGALGAAVAQAAVGHRLGRKTWVFGALGGMAADLDVLIRSPTDPMMAIEYHRHFTHSLAFVPVGGLLISLPWLVPGRFSGRSRWVWAAMTAGYATHALLDCCTSYGTMYLWPFSDLRVAWSFVSIVDLLYTVPLLVGVVWAARRGTRRPAAVSLLVSHIYLALCGVQKFRVSAARDALAVARGHEVERAFTGPMLATNVGWHSIYASGGRYYVDAVYAPWFSETVVLRGSSKPRIGPDAGPAEVRKNPITADALRTFRWFADDWLVADEDSSSFGVCDARYSLEPGGFDPLWCIHLRPKSSDTLVERTGPENRRTSYRDVFRKSFVVPDRATPVP